MYTRIVRADQDNPDREAVMAGASIIRAGGTVIFPTETVYGLGADGLNGEACLKIFMAKNRPADNPLILHISSPDMLDRVAVVDSSDLRSKIMSFWPGPLTVLLRKQPTVPDSVTAGLDTVAVRMPDNPLALALIDSAGVPIAAPSANLSTRPSITDSADAIAEMSGRVDLIYDSGRTAYGIESTIIDLTARPYRILRSGSARIEDLEAVFGHIEITDAARGTAESEVALTPGMKYRHYAPTRPLFLMRNVEEFVSLLRSSPDKHNVLFIGCSELLDGSTKERYDLGPFSDLRQVGSRIFSSFRYLDSGSYELGVIHPFPETGYGLGIMNRIRKASGHRTASAIEIMEAMGSGRIE